MGSVADLTTTGDNDPELFPVQYYRHYMYCDECGSFQIDSWPMPENWIRLNKLVGWAESVAVVSLVSTMLAAALMLYHGAVALADGQLYVDPGALAWTVLSLIVLAAAWALVQVTESKTRFRGVRCGECQTIYEHGSPFFTDLQKNPRNYTMDDVPRPLLRTYQIRGEEVGPAPPEPSLLPP